jgi:hypothetical protein
VRETAEIVLLEEHSAFRVLLTVQFDDSPCEIPIVGIVDAQTEAGIIKVCER